MLRITVPGVEFFDDERNKFITFDSTELVLEHSLVSLSKWESIWEKPFLTNKEPSTEETLSYISCMSLEGDIPPEVLSRLTTSEGDIIAAYINAKKTATWFREENGGRRSSEVVTSELVYYWMITLNIPMECQHWHFARLMTLVRVCSAKNAPASKSKTSVAEMARRRRELNDQRRRETGTQG